MSLQTLIQDRNLLPLQQGSVDRLCGVYAIINAMRLAAPDSRNRQQWYLDTAVEYLSARRRLSEVLLFGMPHNVWVRLAKRLVAEHNRINTTQLTLYKLDEGQKAKDDEIWREIESGIKCGRPIIIDFEGAYRHFTIISHLTPDRIHLFDSNGLKWLQRKSLEIGPVNSGGRFYVNPSRIYSVKSSNEPDVVI